MHQLIESIKNDDEELRGDAHNVDLELVLNGINQEVVSVFQNHYEELKFVVRTSDCYPLNQSN